MDRYKVVNKYLNNEQILLEQWYSKTMALEFGLNENVEFKGPFPSSDKIKEQFLEWVEKHKKNLHKIICDDLNFIEKKKEYKDIRDLIIYISEALEYNYTHVLEISSLLVMIVLDSFCL